MISETGKQKIVRFLQDEVMSSSVREILRESFLKSRPEKDVQTLAASRLAIDFLEDGWKELQKLKSSNADNGEKRGQVGL